MRARYYDPTVGRFLSQDPSGFSSGDVNLYRYAENDPVRNTDRFGLQATSVWNTNTNFGSASISTLDFGTPQRTAPRGVNLAAMAAFQHTFTSFAGSQAPSIARSLAPAAMGVGALGVLPGQGVSRREPATLSNGVPTVETILDDPFDAHFRYGTPLQLAWQQTVNPQRARDLTTFKIQPQLQWISQLSEITAGENEALTRPGTYAVGAAQGSLNTLNGLTDTSIESFNAEKNRNVLLRWTPDVAAPDWSRDVFVPNDPNHGLGKFIGGNSAVTLATAGLGAFFATRGAAVSQGSLYDVGLAKDLRRTSLQFSQVHHVPQSAEAESLLGRFLLRNRAGSEAAIRLSESEHIAVNAAQRLRTTTASARDLLASEIRILRSSSDAPNSAIKKLIDLNRKLHESDYLPLHRSQP